MSCTPVSSKAGAESRLGGRRRRKPTCKIPPVGHGRDVPELPDVGTYSPQGDSPYGMADAVGLVWQFTDYFEDDRTRAVLVKGSSLYNPMLGAAYPANWQSSNWYFPQAKKLRQHNRIMLMDESYDRAGTVGFRCVADHKDGAPAPHHVHDRTRPHAESHVPRGIPVVAPNLRHNRTRPVASVP